LPDINKDTKQANGGGGRGGQNNNVSITSNATKQQFCEVRVFDVFFDGEIGGTQQSAAPTQQTTH
jgi:hypothetical protein